MTIRIANICFAVLLFATAAVMIWIAAGFDTAASVGSTMLDSNVFPIALMAIVLVGCFALILRGIASSENTALFDNAASALRVIGFAMLLVVSVYAWQSAGFFIMSAAFGLVCAALLTVRTWWIYIVAVLFGPLAGLVFAAGLGVQL